jgi:hypothetical protein
LNALELDILRALTGPVFPSEPPATIDRATLARAVRLGAANATPMVGLSLVRQVIPLKPSALPSISKS